MVDEIYINTIKEFGLYDEIWQAFAVFLPIKSVGVQVRGLQHRQLHRQFVYITALSELQPCNAYRHMRRAGSQSISTVLKF